MRRGRLEVERSSKIRDAAALRRATARRLGAEDDDQGWTVFQIPTTPGSLSAV
jgi:hypothetical protein